MLKRRTALLIAAVVVVSVFLFRQITFDSAPAMKYGRGSWDMMQPKSVNTAEYSCASVPRLRNASIKAKGHSIHLTRSSWNATKHLNVYVILHSHVDPGWLKTFEDYYNNSEKPVRQIMNNMVSSLTKHPELRFIWSEVSFLERWWSEANATYRQYFKRLVNEDRLEISGGSWVMTDEATPYFWATIDNMIVGHQYVQKTLNITPTTSWSVDPFGHGLMVPYLLTLSGIQRMVIGRINSNIKDILKQHQQLHFRWAQTWDPEARWAPFVNVLPNLYYTVIDACGTDGQICCQFDVSKSARTMCPERARVDTIQNIAKYAERMASQYRSLQPFYSSDTILIAAGDDFLYSDPEDLERVHRIYTTLFDYINKHQKQFNMDVQFGTVADYFNALKGTEAAAPVLEGDFFPYMDIAYSKTPFWTGFYNHRAYFKRFERIVQSELRSLDLLSVAARKQPSDDLELARRNLALCQHHDAITGTSTREVMNDYMFRLRSALRTILTEQERSLSSANSADTFTTIFDEQFVTATGMQLPRKMLSFSNDTKRHQIQILNQKAFRTMELIRLNVSIPRVTVKQDGKSILAQVVPLQIQPDIFELSFFVALEPFSTAVVSLEQIPSAMTVLTKPGIHNKQLDGPNLEHSDDKIILKNQYFTLYWSIQNGQSHRIVYSDGSVETDFALTFSHIRDDGGSYTMVARGEFQEIRNEPLPPARIIRGPLYSKITQRLGPELTYTITVLNSTDDSARSLQVDLFTNLSLSTPGQTFFMNLFTTIQNDVQFYTDVNGMYLIQRSYNKSVKFEANVYPMASEAMIEDNSLRCTVLGAQPTGITSASGTLMLMVDREMVADDGKGLAYLEDSESHPPHLKYRIIFESKVSGNGESDYDQQETYSKKAENISVSTNVDDVLYHSQFVQQNLEELLYPASLFISANASSLDDNGKKPSTASLPPLPDNIQLINARYIAPNNILISMRQLPYDCSTKPRLKHNYDVDLIRQFYASFHGSIYLSNLTGTKIGSQISLDSIAGYFVQALHIVTFLVKLN